MNLASILLSAMASGCFGPVMADQAGHDIQDTLRASVVSSTYGSLVVPRRIGSEELGTVTGISEAIRRFSGVQLRDYGGAGGLKTVNVRSLGSEHTGVFIDGIQVDNAQNMQVDLGRFGTDGFGSVSLFPGHKVSPLQSAKEYSSASSLYLESADPVFSGGRRDNLKVVAGAGSFLSFRPGLSWEHLFKGGASLRLSGEAVTTKGEYRFHVKDYRTYPDGTTVGYDTTMIRKNCDLTSVRAEARLFGSPSGETYWNVHAYFYGSGRGLPGPVYKKAGEYPLSEDRQTDRDAFVQGRFQRDLGRVWSLSGRAKLSLSHLEYMDYPELRPETLPARYNYRNHSAYVSTSAMARLGGCWKVNLAQDIQYDYLDSDLRDFAYPGRLSSWSCASALFGKGAFEASATLLYLYVHDSFLAGNGRSQATRDAFMPSAVVRWKCSERLTISSFAKRSYRMPTFNDLYYTIVGAKTLDPEDATQLDLGADWTAVKSGTGSLAFKMDIYRNQLKNKIIAVPTSNQFRWSMYNLGKVEVLGADVSADCSMKVGTGEYGLFARYTFQQSRNRSDPEALTWGGQIPYIPVHSGSFNVHGILSGWRADLTLFATGERFTTSVNLPSYRLAPWTTLDASISKTIGAHATVKLCLDNLLDQQYEIVDNYPMPGFNFLLSLILSF